MPGWGSDCLGGGEGDLRPLVPGLSLNPAGVCGLIHSSSQPPHIPKSPPGLCPCWVLPRSCRSARVRVGPPLSLLRHGLRSALPQQGRRPRHCHFAEESSI